MRKLYTTLLAITIGFSASAQTVAGNAFRIDYDEFVGGSGGKYFDCGNDNMLNTGNEITVMTWIQLRSTNDNQKMVGKFGLNSSGFSFGVNQGKIYPALWNPTQYDTFDGLMHPTGVYWYHIAFTFKAGDAMKTYINGIETGSHPVTNSPLTPNTDPLIIGVASWDLVSFQSFGNMDEMAIFDVALTEAQIKAQMFKPLTGSEPGIVAAYNFNETSGSSLSDISGNGNNGTGNSNFSGSEWVASYTPLANSQTENATDINALWKGLSFTNPRFTSTNNGLNLLSSTLDTATYAVFGHNNSGGVTTSNIPSNAPSNFERTERIWSMTTEGLPIARVIANISEAAGGSGEITLNEPAENYTLLWRPFGAAEFTPVASGNSYNSGVISFNDVPLPSGEYSLAVGDAPMEPTSVAEHVNFDAISIYPNPSDGNFNVTFDSPIVDNATLEIYDLQGRIIHQQAIQLVGNDTKSTVNIAGTKAGIYLLKITSSNKVFSQRLVVE